MNPPSMESIFLILSGVILVAGVLYWLWSHIQLTQKKVQLLENAVFELRGMLANNGDGHPVPLPPNSPTRHIQVNAASGGGDVEVIRTDDEDESWGDERMSTPLDALEVPTLEVADDLQPGGRAAPAAEASVDEESQSENFRRLFAVQEVADVVTSTSVAPSPASAPALSVVKTPESLESMPVKELRRLAEQRGIAGAADMRKKEILAALRQQVTSIMSLTLSEPNIAQPSTYVEDSHEIVDADDIREVNIDKIIKEGSDDIVTTEILE